MFRRMVALTTLILTAMTTLEGMECTSSFELGLGWRRDSLHWKLNHLTTSHFEAEVDSHIKYKDINYYTAHFKTHTVGEEFYFRLSADYGLSDKGRAKERFGIYSPILGQEVDVSTNHKIKRRSEVYDFNGAIGYPFMFDNCRLLIAPLIGFSFHRQHIRVQSHRHSGSFSYDSMTFVPDPEPRSHFSVNSSNPFDLPSSDPFSSGYDPTVAHALGLSVLKRTTPYRFTWYGFYLGVDMAYALDSEWTLFTELECHFMDSCHRKRKSVTGVFFVDDYHHDGAAHGFDGSVGVNYDVGSCYYGSIEVNFKCWEAHSKHDNLNWNSVGVFATLGYFF